MDNKMKEKRIQNNNDQNGIFQKGLFQNNHMALYIFITRSQVHRFHGMNHWIIFVGKKS